MDNRKRVSVVRTKRQTNFDDVNLQLVQHQELFRHMQQEMSDLKTSFQRIQSESQNMRQANAEQTNNLQGEGFQKEQVASDQKHISVINDGTFTSSQKNLTNSNVRNVSTTLITNVPSLILPEAPAGAVESKLAYQLADDVTAVVGLKEALTWKYRWLKIIWAITLFAGIAATVWFVYDSTAEYLEEPTAIKIKMKIQLTYPYPPMFVCSEAWLDVPKALSLGLSLEGLKHSFGYFDSSDKGKPNNVTIAREEFIEFFEKHNFSSFNDYLITVSVDVPVERVIALSAFSKPTRPAHCVLRAPVRLYLN